jgi:hypothetical protein
MLTTKILLRTVGWDFAWDQTVKRVQKRVCFALESWTRMDAMFWYSTFARIILALWLATLLLSNLCPHFELAVALKILVAGLLLPLSSFPLWFRNRLFDGKPSHVWSGIRRRLLIFYMVTRDVLAAIDAVPVKPGRATVAVLFMLIVLFPFMTHAAAPGAADNQWPPINSQELAMKDCLQSPGAPAIILYHEETWNDAKGTADFYFRIKVFTKPGEDYGKITIPYSPGLISVSDIHGRTIRPDGNILDFDGEIYDREVVKSGGIGLHEKAFVLPGVQPGSVLEYAYRLSGVNDFSVYSFPPSAGGVDAARSAEWKIQQDAFMMRGKFLIVPSLRWHLEWSKMGMFDLPNLQKLPEGGFLVEVLNVPPILKEEYMPPEGALRAAFDFYYITSDQFLPNSRAYWEALASEMGKNLDYLKHPGSVIKKEVARIVATGESADIKARKIYARMFQIRNLDTEPEKTS